MTSAITICSGTSGVHISFTVDDETTRALHVFQKIFSQSCKSWPPLKPNGNFFHFHEKSALAE